MTSVASGQFHHVRSVLNDIDHASARPISGRRALEPAVSIETGVPLATMRVRSRSLNRREPELLREADALQLALRPGRDRPRT